MKPLEHTSALGWIIALSVIGTLIFLFATVASNGYGGPSPVWIGLTAFCGAFFVPAVVGSIVLHGVKQMLTQTRGSETVATSIADSTVAPPTTEPPAAI
ncbi:hypothetical protein [Agrococcus jejuensis]|uniref:Uncharacterized protein n=1 Tax=Agrococcus jejuensis TaxID=399736 RepID=A0A1G8BXR2_9MICO|nr:hypothetical protein [Agrococcus jejuensis]SDH37918.1 hypothetical protein SAMN04489720_1091 [Agrococcus jejuensis]